MALDAQVLLSILSHESSAGDISRTLRVTPASYSMVLSDGTGANQAQVAWSDSRTITAGGSDTFDLAALQDDRGTVTFSAIKIMFLRNTGSGQLDWSGGGWGGGPFDDVSTSNVFIKAGAVMLLAAPSADGYAVGATPQTVVLSSTPGTTYDILLIGEGTIS